MTDQHMTALVRCMGGRYCRHAIGTCTATNEAYQAKIAARASAKAVNDWVSGIAEEAAAAPSIGMTIDHPNATDWQNRAEHAEAEAAELRRHAVEMAGAAAAFLEGADSGMVSVARDKALRQAITAWTAYLAGKG